ncbi:MAG TPA: hypothetical protein VHY84_22765 [Bryobacteraceae bacterium]|jgi:hypothetical protein|nr:hypothetical protein [Bryobacteraceae bacterium]
MRAAVLLALPALSSVLFAQIGGPATPVVRTLRVIRPVISQSEDGPAIESGASFVPGDIAFFSFQVENYRISATGKVQLAGHIDVTDPKGTRIIPRDEQVIGTSISEEDKDWKPKLRLQIQLPSLAPPGNYTVKFEVTDQQAKQAASGELAFPVGGKGVDPASTLTIRNLGFYRTQDDETALRTVAYRAGDILWVRFDITGYKYGEQNSIDVAYDVAVLSPDGKQLFEQDDAAVERSQAFYPQPWVPGDFNLSLQSTMRAGTYTLVITARDAPGKQTTSVKADFRVE